MDPNSHLTVEQCRTLLNTRLPCHRLPPANCKVAFQALCQELFRRAQQEPHIAHILLILPKLILTTPGDAKASKQRERHIRHNIDCARAGKWQQLYSRSYECQIVTPANDPEHITDDDPAAVTSRDISRLIKHAMQGEPIKGWKELHSPGLALPTPENFAHAMAKLRPHRQGPPALPAYHGPLWKPTTNRIAQAVLKLRRNRARDPGGWSHELLIWLWHNPNNRDELVKWVHFIASPTLDTDLGITLAHAQVVLLNKPGRTSVRPILLVNIWRKLTSALLAAEALPMLGDLTASHQYGHQKQGAAQLYLALSAHAERNPNHMTMQLDIANAFGSINRTKAYETIVEGMRTRGADPEWLSWLHHYMRQPTYILPPHQGGSAECTFDGIAQGDPASALIFGTAIALHMAKFPDAPFIGIYVDDICIAAEVTKGPHLLQGLGIHLAELGLSLQPDKTRTLLPPEMPPEQLLDADLHSIRHTFRAQVLKFARKRQAFDGTLDTVTPYGPDQWAAQSLQEDAASLAQKLRKLERIPQGATEGSPAVQTALLILRSIWPGACLHLLRQLPPNLTQEYTETVQDLLLNTLQTLLRLSTLTPPQKRVITLPLAHGGLAFPHLPTLAIAARISMLATVPRTPANRAFFDSHLRDELTHLGAQFDELIDGRTADILGQIADPPPGRSFRGLQKRLMTQHYTQLSRELLHLGPEHQRLIDAWFAHHSNDDPMAKASHPGQSSWLLAKPTPQRSLPDAAVIYGIRRRLGLSANPNDMTCTHVTSNGRECGKVIDHDAIHAMNCQRGYIHLRHDQIRDHLAQYARTCGFVAQSEQCMRTSDDDSGPRDLHRADVHIGGAPTGEVWIDVRVCHAQKPRNIDPFLRTQEITKNEQYGFKGPPPVGVHKQVRPFVLDVRGRAAQAAVELANWLIGHRLARLQSQRGITYAEATAIATEEFWTPISVGLCRCWGSAISGLRLPLP